VALIAHLPPESAYARATGGWWTDAHELAATTVEVLHALTLLTARAYGAKGRQRPLRVPRPGAPKRRPGAMSVGEFMDTLATGVR
jgi:hypothetical protein